MKILIIDNAAVVKKGKSYCTNSLNGLFLSDLISCGNDITYFQFAFDTKNSISNFDLKANGIKYTPLKIFNNRMIRYIYAYLSVIPYILKNDFVYLYYPSSFKYVPFLCRLFNKKYGMYIRGEQNITDSVSKKNYFNAYTIFTVSDYFTNYINNLVGEIKAHTIRPMIPFDEKDVVTSRNYKINGKFNLLFLGRIAEDKGIKELFKAVKILKDKGYLFELNLVGNGEYFAEANQILKSLDIEDIAYLKGAIYEPEKVKECYMNADIYILPTYHEGFPRTLYEAMIFGTPIITTFVGGISALMKDRENCLKIEPQSVKCIVEGLEFAFNNYDKMVKYAQNASATVARIVDSKRLTHAQHLNKVLKQ